MNNEATSNLWSIKLCLYSITVISASSFIAGGTSYKSVIYKPMYTVFALRNCCVKIWKEIKMEIIWYDIYVAFDEQLLFFMICRTMVGNDSSFMYFILYVAYSKVLLLIYTVLLFNKNLFWFVLRLYTQDVLQNIYVVSLRTHFTGARARTRTHTHTHTHRQIEVP